MLNKQINQKKKKKEAYKTKPNKTKPKKKKEKKHTKPNQTKPNQTKPKNMGLLDNFKAFVHSITTQDHYASYNSPYRNASSGESQLPNGISGGSMLQLNPDINSSTTSLNDTSAGFYRPGMKSSQTQIQDVPMQNFDSNGLPPLPSIDSLWDRIEHWIDEEYPELDDNLNDGVTSADLNEFLLDLRCGSRSLPEDFRQFYKRHDGQLRGGKPTGLIMGLVLLDLETIVEENMMWNKVVERLETQQQAAKLQQAKASVEAKEGSSSLHQHQQQQQQTSTFMNHQRSIPPNSIQPEYFNRGWIVLLKDNTGNQVAMDLNPGPLGTWGQIILFGRDFDTKLVIAQNLQDFIFSFVLDLEAGNFLIDSSEYLEELGYLSPERDGDYMIGDEEENQGELSFYDKDGKEFGKGSIRGRPNYIEVLKKRALKRYGLNENFQTIYQPQRPHKKTTNPSAHSGRNSPMIQSRNGSTQNLRRNMSNNNSTASLSSSLAINNSNTNSNTNSRKKTPVPSPLVNLDKSSSTFSIPKETIIDAKKQTSMAEDSAAKETNLSDDLEELTVDDLKKKEETKVVEKKQEEQDEEKADLKPVDKDSEKNTTLLNGAASSESVEQLDKIVDNKGPEKIAINFTSAEDAKADESAIVAEKKPQTTILDDEQNDSTEKEEEKEEEEEENIASQTESTGTETEKPMSKSQKKKQKKNAKKHAAQL